MSVPASKASPNVRLAQALLWITPALWSSNYIIARMAEGVVAPHVLALGRWVLALLLMLLLVWSDRAAMQRALRTEWWQCLVLGALGMWICGAFVYLGAQTTSAVNIGLIYAAGPVGIAITSRWLLHERSSGKQQLGMLLALVGVLVVVSRGDPAGLLKARWVVGDWWIVAACVSWVGYSVLQQRWPSVLGARQRLACITAGGVLVLLPFTALEWALVAIPAWSTKALVLIVLAALLPGFFSYQAYAVMLRELGATRSSMVLYLAPVYGAITAWLVLGERPQWFHVLGAVLILPSIYLATAAPRSNEATVPVHREA